MKTEKWYDVGCDICGFHLSTDFKYGMLPSAKEAVRCAQAEGFREIDGKIYCPYCLHWKDRGYIKEVNDNDHK